jgi:hypothetical protein
MGVSAITEKQKRRITVNRTALAKRNKTGRFATRIMVSVIGFTIALYYLVQVISTPIFASEARVWANIPNLVMFFVGALIFYWGAFTDFDQSKHERFFG